MAMTLPDHLVNCEKENMEYTAVKECSVDVSSLNDGHCNDEAKTEECFFDGSDCPGISISGEELFAELLFPIQISYA